MVLSYIFPPLTEGDSLPAQADFKGCLFPVSSCHPWHWKARHGSHNPLRLLILKHIIASKPMICVQRHKKPALFSNCWLLPNSL